MDHTLRGSLLEVVLHTVTKMESEYKGQGRNGIPLYANLEGERNPWAGHVEL